MPAASVDAGAAVLGLFYWPMSATDNICSPARYGLLVYLVTLTYLHANNNFSSEVLRASPLLLAVTHLGLLAFSAQTMELLGVVNFRGTCVHECSCMCVRNLQALLPSDMSFPLHGTSYSIPTTATCSFSFNPVTHEVGLHIFNAS